MHSKMQHSVKQPGSTSTAHGLQCGWTSAMNAICDALCLLKCVCCMIHRLPSYGTFVSLLQHCLVRKSSPCAIDKMEIEYSQNGWAGDLLYLSRVVIATAYQHCSLHLAICNAGGPSLILNKHRDITKPQHYTMLSKTVTQHCSNKCIQLCSKKSTCSQNACLHGYRYLCV